MDKKVKQLALAYSRMTTQERADFDKAIRDAKSRSDSYVFETFETHVKRTIGPMDSAFCDCCGK